MLRLDALGFLLFAVIAAFAGYGGVADYSWDGAKVLVFASLALAALCLLVDAVERRCVKESAPADN